MVTQDGLLPCGNLRCGIDDLLRRRRGANHAHKAHKAQKKGDWNYFYNFIDFKILSVKITFLLVKITFIECPILATSTFF